MGNVFCGDVQLAKAASAIEVYEAAEASIMQTQVQAGIAAIIAAGTDDIFDISLAGAGDGHQFVCTLLHGDSTRATDASLTAEFYLAASKVALDAVMTAELAAITATRLIIGHAEAGAAQGHRWMGMILHRAP